VTDQPGGPTAVTGVDGCARGWVAVTLGQQVPAVTVAATLDGLPLTAVTGIDMPLGLLARGWREADRLARRALGRRGVTVFAIPPRPALQAPTYAEANRICRELTGQGLSVQAYGLRRKIAEADEYRRAVQATHGPVQAPEGTAHPTGGTAHPAGGTAHPAGGTAHPTDGTPPGPVRLYEVHPELSFAALAGGAPLPDSKHTLAGLAVRRGLLRAAGITLPPRVAGLAENDLLDAAAVAWSARRIAAGLAVVLAGAGQRADDGTEITIRY
jgi:predicted RNase H-like nuclease